MSVHNDSRGDAEPRPEHNICGLASDSRQLSQLFDRLGHLAVKTLDQHLRCTLDVFGLCPVETRRMDQLLDFSEWSLSQCPGIREESEELRGDLIYCCIGCLGGECSGNHQLEGVAVCQWPDDVRIRLPQRIENGSYALRRERGLCLRSLGFRGHGFFRGNCSRLLNGDAFDSSSSRRRCECLRWRKLFADAFSGLLRRLHHSHANYRYTSQDLIKCSNFSISTRFPLNRTPSNFRRARCS